MRRALRDPQPVKADECISDVVTGPQTVDKKIFNRLSWHCMLGTSDARHSAMPIKTRLYGQYSVCVSHFVFDSVGALVESSVQPCIRTVVSFGSHA